MIVEATKKIVEKIDLTSGEAEQVMDGIMGGAVEQINLASFLAALRMKGDKVGAVTSIGERMGRRGA